MKTFSDYILEKQNFIFGGKHGLTGKEYGTNKTFSELKRDDKFYRYFVDVRVRDTVKVKGPEERTVSDIFPKGQGYTSIKYSGADAFISIRDEDLESYFSMQPDSQMHWANFYSTYEMTNEEVKEICENILRERGMHESVGFIFGGKSGLTGKEYGTGIKTFVELVPGDSIYVYELTSDGKRTRTNVFDYKKRRWSPVNDSLYFIGEWRNEKLKRSKSILLSRDCFERSAFSSYKTMVMSTYEMTDEELAKFVSNEDNEIRN